MCNDNLFGREKCKIIKHVEIVEGVYELVIESKDIAKTTIPGQFVNLYCDSNSMLLPRPISICEVDADAGWVKLIYAVVGDGTKLISRMSVGQTIDVLGPLGNGYTLGNEQEVLIVGGGVGTPPLVELAKRLPGKKHIYLGFRTAPYLVEELSKYGTVHVATDDGSVGYQGTVIELMNKENAQGACVYACGPKPMLKALQSWVMEKGIPAQLSLEERMGCGFGACVGCVCKIKVQNETGYTYKKVCKDGPVFSASEVMFE